MVEKLGCFLCFLYHSQHLRPRPRNQLAGGIPTDDAIRLKDIQLIQLLTHLHSNVNITPDQHGHRKIHF